VPEAEVGEARLPTEALLGPEAEVGRCRGFSVVVVFVIFGVGVFFVSAAFGTRAIVTEYHCAYRRTPSNRMAEGVRRATQSRFSAAVTHSRGNARVSLCSPAARRVLCVLAGRAESHRGLLERPARAEGDLPRRDDRRRPAKLHRVPRDGGAGESRLAR